MTSPTDLELESLRHEVDRLDTALVDLFVERLRAVRDLAALKQRAAAGQPAIRPGREAVILRRLVDRAGDRFPPGTLVRIWRELLAATTRAQAPLRIAACVPAGQPELWDIARDHFGSQSPIRRADGSTQALRWVADDEVHLAVLPLPNEPEAWWVQLLDSSVRPLRVLARLPFWSTAAYPEGSGGFVVGAIAPDPSDADVSLLAVETTADLGRARLLDLLAAWRPRWAATEDRGQDDRARHLLELDGFLAPPQPDLAEALRSASPHVLRTAWLGSYARPLSAGR